MKPTEDEIALAKRTVAVLYEDESNVKQNERVKYITKLIVEERELDER